MQKNDFGVYLQNVGISNEYTIRNYCSWVKRTEETLNLILVEQNVDTESKISSILNQLQRDPKYSRVDLLHDTGTALRHYARFLLQEDSISKDLRLLLSAQDTSATTTSILIEARLGQGVFRKRTVDFWEGKCAITGSNAASLLIASHIKPWKYSSNHERLDGENGILLMPNLDKLFDKGLISFSADGSIILSRDMSIETESLFGIQKGMRLAKTSDKLNEFLCFHRGLYNL